MDNIPRNASPASASRTSTARSTVFNPADVSLTCNERRSSGSGSRATSPCSSRRSMRFVIAPDESIVDRINSVGVIENGAPCRRNVPRTSKAQIGSPNGFNAEFARRSRIPASRNMRPTTASGRESKSGRSVRHCLITVSIMSRSMREFLQLCIFMSRFFISRGMDRVAVGYDAGVRLRARCGRSFSAYPTKPFTIRSRAATIAGGTRTE